MTFTDFILDSLNLTGGGKNFFAITMWALRTQKAVYNVGD